jgi:hypothetical protein
MNVGQRIREETMRLRYLLFISALVVLCPGSVRADEGVAFFEKKIRPMFVEHCYKCHSASAKKLKGGAAARYRRRDSQRGRHWSSVVAGKPKESIVVAALRHEDMAMPPDGKLSDEIVNNVVAWIESGGALPADAASGPTPRREAFRITPQDREHWAFRPLKKPAVPSVMADTDIDRFLQARLRAEGLSSAKPADKYTLLRPHHI